MDDILIQPGSSDINTSSYLPDVDVIMPCLNEADSIEQALNSIKQQTVKPNRVIVADGGSTDRTPAILEDWCSRLPLTILTNPKQRQGPGLNLCLEKSSSRYVARMDAHSTWNDQYLEILVENLESHHNAGAFGGGVYCSQEASSKQRDFWRLMTHPFGTGGPSYRNTEELDETTTAQSPVYRREALKEAGGFREDIPWAEDDELHNRLGELGWSIFVHPEAHLYYVPRQSIGSIIRQFLHYGRGRASLSRESIYPSERHQYIDRALMMWTLAFCWNPIGWALALFYQMAVVLIALNEWIEDRASFRLVYLFPLIHAAYWMGWTRERFL